MVSKLTLSDRIEIWLARIACLFGKHQWWVVWNGPIPEWGAEVALRACPACGRCEWEDITPEVADAE